MVLSQFLRFGTKYATYHLKLLKAKGGEERRLPKRICEGSGAFIIIQNSLTNNNKITRRLNLC
jgi:hypothetical protein